jgi:PIN domain nuclease of toxin-antitoxin system
MSGLVLDASAYLALIQEEKGHDLVRLALDDSITSAVTKAEVIHVLQRVGLEINAVSKIVNALIPHALSFDDEQSTITGFIAAKASPVRLSLGDRACLALAYHYGYPVLTADRIWADLDLGVEVRLIR